MSGLFFSPWFKPTDSDNAELAGAQLLFYDSAAPTTPLAVYADFDLLDSLGTTVTADGDGQFVPIYMQPVAYRVVLKNAAGDILLDIAAYIPPDGAYGVVLAFQLPNGSATPSVQGRRAVITADTDITNFLGGKTGQIVTVIRGSSDRIVEDNVNIIMLGGSDVTLTSTLSAIDLRYDGAVWRQFSAAGVGAGTAGAALSTPGGRLSAVSGVSVTETDQVGVTTLYLIPTDSVFTNLYDGSTDRLAEFDTQIALILDATGHLANGVYDVGQYWTGTALGVGTSPAWAGANDPGTGAGTAEREVFHGRLVNKNAMVLRNNSANSATIAARRVNIIGTIRITTIAGQTEDSAKKRFISNVYNPIDVDLRCPTESTDQWAYNVATWRQARASTANQFEYVQAVSGRRLEAEVDCFSFTDGSTGRFLYVGLGIDSTSVNSAQTTLPHFAVNVTGPPAFTSFQLVQAKYLGSPGLGYHKIVWLEYGNASNNNYFQGDGGVLLQSGIFGKTTL